MTSRVILALLAALLGVAARLGALIGAATITDRPPLFLLAGLLAFCVAYSRSAARHAGGLVSSQATRPSGFVLYRHHPDLGRLRVDGPAPHGRSRRSGCVGHIAPVTRQCPGSRGVRCLQHLHRALLALNPHLLAGLQAHHRIATANHSGDAELARDDRSVRQWCPDVSYDRGST